MIDDMVININNIFRNR